ncbi:MAG: response regulator transcription factor [Pseudomonadota bacterium]
MIRVLVVEDQSMVLGALAALLNLEPDIEVAGQVSDGRAALEALASTPVDVVVTDIEMPELSGLDLAAELRKQGSEARVLVLTTFDRPGYVRRALDLGVRGFMLKDAPSDRLAEAIRLVARGGRAIDPELAVHAWEAEDPLTERERQVLRLAGEGRTSEEIAGTLHLSGGTVRNYLSEAIGKLGASNRVEAARIARQKGWL